MSFRKRLALKKSPASERFFLHSFLPGNQPWPSPRRWPSDRSDVLVGARTFREVFEQSPLASELQVVYLFHPHAPSVYIGGMGCC